MALLIYDKQEIILRRFVAKHYPGAEIKAHIGKAWHQNRYIYVTIGNIVPGKNEDAKQKNSMLTSEIHYEYANGKWSLHFENESSSQFLMELKTFINDQIEDDDIFRWHRWWGKNRGKLDYDVWVNNDQELTDGLVTLRKRVDPLIKQFLNVDLESEEERVSNFMGEEADIADEPKLSFNTIADPFSASKKSEPYICSISELPFERLLIPYYQRPYKWSTHNVNQLINDVILFSDKQEYRLGTLVLYEDPQHPGQYDIVDGQQRIVTLSLLLNELLSDSEHYEFIPDDFSVAVQRFMRRRSFKHPSSIANVKTNLATIKRRLSDFDDAKVRFLLFRCQFVVVKLNNLTEAFQFFDSQNARGKDLEPHDLLKAFHLREMPVMDSEDMSRLSFWEAQETKNLVSLFLALYRIKRWSLRKTALEFTKDDVHVFKGVSLKKDTRYPAYMMAILSHYYMEKYNDDIDRQIDNHQMGYPFQLEAPIINGSRFFDMVRHYESLISSAFNAVAKDNSIIHVLDSYTNKNRRGDQYVREMFDLAILYYLDKFGTDNIDTVVTKAFIWAYKVRLSHSSVYMETVDNEAASAKGFFAMLRSASSPQDVMDWDIEPLQVLKRTELTEIIDLFKELNYYDVQ